jgi:hypothetical protein
MNWERPDRVQAGLTPIYCAEQRLKLRGHWNFLEGYRDSLPIFNPEKDSLAQFRPEHYGWARILNCGTSAPAHQMTEVSRSEAEMLVDNLNEGTLYSGCQLLQGMVD